MDRELQYWVLHMIADRKYGDDYLQRQTEWCKGHGHDLEYKACEIVLSNQYQEFLSSEYKGHKVEYVNDCCLKIDNRYIKVVADDKWAYKIQKTQVKAQGGALGFMREFFVKQWWWQDFGLQLCKDIEKVKECKMA